MTRAIVNRDGTMTAVTEEEAEAIEAIDSLFEETRLWTKLHKHHEESFTIGDLVTLKWYGNDYPQIINTRGIVIRIHHKHKKVAGVPTMWLDVSTADGVVSLPAYNVLHLREK